MKLNFLAPLIRREFDASPTSTAIRHAYHRVRHEARELRSPLVGERLAALAKSWWYYTVELSGGLFTTGHIDPDLPFGPRLLMRNCDLAGRDCIDLGTMEGLMPVLMKRANAKTVVAADASFHCFNKMMALQKQYDVKFEFQEVGLMYDLSKKVRQQNGFDLVVLGGVLYHVFSPLHVLAGVRPLVRNNGLFIVSTNVVNSPEVSALFNHRGGLQTEENTFWYVSIPMFEYALRYFRLLPIDCTYVPHADTKLRVLGLDSGLMTVVCRAVDEALGSDDTWAHRSSESSWEYLQLCDVEMARRQPRSEIVYKKALDERLLAPDGRSVDLLRAARTGPQLRKAARQEDGYVLKLSHVS